MLNKAWPIDQTASSKPARSPTSTARKKRPSVSSSVLTARLAAGTRSEVSIYIGLPSIVSSKPLAIQPKSLRATTGSTATPHIFQSKVSLLLLQTPCHRTPWYIRCLQKTGCCLLMSRKRGQLPSRTTPELRFKINQVPNRTPMIQ